MNEALAYLSLALLMVLPPAALVVRYRVGERIPWWFVVLLIAGVGWLLLNIGNYCYGQYVCQSVLAASKPADALARCTDDGARNAFALYFGWLFALLYAAPYVLIFSVTTWLRDRQHD
jgi:hypothetical protein